MRSGVLIGAAMAVLTVRLLAGSGDAPAAAPAATRAASAAAALLSGTAAVAPSGAAAPAAIPAARHADAEAGRRPASSVAQAGAGSNAMRAASVEAEVRLRRTRGDGEDAVYRVRTAQLPAAEVAQLMAMESAEAAWQRQLAAMPSGCTAACEAAAPQHVTASAYRHDAAPRLTLE